MIDYSLLEFGIECENDENTSFYSDIITESFFEDISGDELIIESADDRLSAIGAWLKASKKKFVFLGACIAGLAVIIGRLRVKSNAKKETAMLQKEMDGLKQQYSSCKSVYDSSVKRYQEARATLNETNKKIANNDRSYNASVKGYKNATKRGKASVTDLGDVKYISASRRKAKKMFKSDQVEYGKKKTALENDKREQTATKNDALAAMRALSKEVDSFAYEYNNLAKRYNKLSSKYKIGKTADMLKFTQSTDALKKDKEK